jgi:hypothetical protein
MRIRAESQASPVADAVEAKVAVMHPILVAIVESLKAEVVEAMGFAAENKTRGTIPLHLLSRIHRNGDGDIGIAFEYAIHDAVVKRNPAVMERVSDALKLCRIRRGQAESIFFALEKGGSRDLINSRMELITENSVVLTGVRGRPIRLQQQLGTLSDAFRTAAVRQQLPQSIRGLWRADLFLGSSSPDHWVGTTVKINPAQLEGDQGLRIGIVPRRSGSGDSVRLDEKKNLVVCPVPHDGSYMQLFYETWFIAKALMANDFQMPSEVQLPDPVDRQVAREFATRRNWTVAEVLDATRILAQPHLLTTLQTDVSQASMSPDNAPATSVVVVPYPQQG